MNVSFASDGVSYQGLLATGVGNGLPKTTAALVAELQLVVGDSPDRSAEILTAMNRLWNCVDLDQVQSGLVHFKEDQRLPDLLQSAQWVFQHQDIRDWPKGGRQRPLAAIAQALNTPSKFAQSRC